MPPGVGKEGPLPRRGGGGCSSQAVAIFGQEPRFAIRNPSLVLVTGAHLPDSRPRPKRGEGCSRPKAREATSRRPGATARGRSSWKAPTASPATSWCNSPATTCSRRKGSRSLLRPPPTFFLEDTPTAVLVRQVLGAVAQFEKATTRREAGGGTEAEAGGDRQVRGPQEPRRDEPRRCGAGEVASAAGSPRAAS